MPPGEEHVNQDVNQESEESIMFELNGPALHYALDDAGRCASFIHVKTGHETVELPGHIFKLIYSIPGT